MSDVIVVKGGLVIEQRPGEKFVVEIKVGNEVKRVLATLSGQIRKFRIRITKGDFVTLEVSKYDCGQGRITYREKEEVVPLA